jgi:aminotransferase
MIHISEREEELPDAVIGKLMKIASEDKSIASLGPGEPNFDLPRPLVAEVKRLANKCNHYSAAAGRTELREALAKKVWKENHIKAEPENIIVTSGSQEALLLAGMCTLDVSEQVILPQPCFMGYIPMFDLIDAQIVPVQLKEENKFELNPDDLKKVIDKKKTKVLLINSPSNPTGNVIRKKVLEEVADIAIENDLCVFSDEAYEKIVYDAKHYSIGALNGMQKHVITFQSFSKTYAMCGFRVGYAVAHESLAKAMSKTHVYSTLSAPTISQMLALKALQLSPKYTNDMVKEYRRRRDYIVSRLNGMGLPTPMPEGAFYTFSNIQTFSKDSFKFASDLLKQKVAVVPGIEFGPCGEGYIRCSYATKLDTIKIAMDRLEKYVQKLAWKS